MCRKHYKEPNGILLHFKYPKRLRDKATSQACDAIHSGFEVIETINDKYEGISIIEVSELEKQMYIIKIKNSIE